MDYAKWESLVAPGGMVEVCYERRWLRKLRCIAAGVLHLHLSAEHPELAHAHDFMRRSIDRRRDSTEKLALRHQLRHYLGGDVLVGGLGDAAHWFALGALDMPNWSRFSWQLRTLIEGTIAGMHVQSGRAAPYRVPNLARVERLRQIRQEHGAVISDIVRNPYATGVPTLGITLAGLSGKAVYDTACGVYERGDPADVAAMHDALLEAGCDNEEVMRHIASRKFHYPGCWVVDMILAKPNR